MKSRSRHVNIRYSFGCVILPAANSPRLIRSAYNRCRQVEADTAYYEKPEMTPEQLARLEKNISVNIDKISGLLL